MSLKDVWGSLRGEAEKARSRRIVDLFDTPGRASGFSASACGMLFDFSKTTLDTAAMQALLRLAEAAQVENARDAMFSGEKINSSENRAVLHCARSRGGGHGGWSTDHA